MDADCAEPSNALPRPLTTRSSSPTSQAATGGRSSTRPFRSALPYQRPDGQPERCRVRAPLAVPAHHGPVHDRQHGLVGDRYAARHLKKFKNAAKAGPLTPGLELDIFDEDFNRPPRRQDGGRDPGPRPVDPLRVLQESATRPLPRRPRRLALDGGRGQDRSGGMSVIAARSKDLVGPRPSARTPAPSPGARRRGDRCRTPCCRSRRCA